MSKNKWVKDLNIGKSKFSSWTAEKPKDIPASFWCMKHSYIEPETYLDWARAHFKLPVMNKNYMNFKADTTFWNQLQSVANWSEHMVPIYFWKNTLFVLVSEPLDNSWSFPVNYILGSPEQLSFFWQKLNNEEVNSFITNENDAEENQHNEHQEQESYIAKDNLKAELPADMPSMPEINPSEKPKSQNTDANVPADVLHLSDFKKEEQAKQKDLTSETLVQSKKETKASFPEVDPKNVNDTEKTALIKIDEHIEQQNLESHNAQSNDLFKTENLEKKSDPIKTEKTSVDEVGDLFELYNQEQGNDQSVDLLKANESAESLLEDTASEKKTSAMDMGDLFEQLSQNNTKPKDSISSNADSELNLIDLFEQNSNEPTKEQNDNLDLDLLGDLANNSSSSDDTLEGIFSDNPVKGKNESSNFDLLNLSDPAQEGETTESLDLLTDDNSIDRKTASFNVTKNIEMPDLSVTTDSLKLDNIKLDKTLAKPTKPKKQKVVTPATEKDTTNKFSSLMTFKKINKDFIKSIALEFKDNRIHITHQDGTWKLKQYDPIGIDTPPCLFKFCMISKLPFHGTISDQDSIKKQLFEKLNINLNNQHITLFPLVDNNKSVNRFILSLGNKDNLPALDRLNDMTQVILSEMA